MVEAESWLNAANYRSFPHMRRIVGYLLRFASNCRKGNNSRTKSKDLTGTDKSSLSLPELKNAERRLIYVHQQRYFKDEIELIKIGGLPQNHILSRLGAVVQLDQDRDLLRLGGRVVHGHLKEEAKHPYLLHPDDCLTEKLVQHLHEDVLKHTGGLNCLKCELHRSYWVVGSIGTLKRVLRECVECRKASPRSSIQRMAPLPECRIPGEALESPTPFMTVIMDAAGPWLTKYGRSRARTKRWLLIFRCAVSGAVCHEMLYDMSEDAFLMALERFKNRFVLPKEIISDKGTNFVGGNNELTKLWKGVQLKKPEYQFNFSPPESPHFNGLAERAVQAAKRALRVVLKDAVPTDEELVSTFLAVERLLNDRPVALKNPDSRDLEAITPSHFLMRGNIGQDLAPVEGGDLRKRYAYIRRLTDQFWQRYVAEIVPQLRQITKWKSEKPDSELAEGDVVVVLDGDGHRVQHRYPLGLITEAEGGLDGLPRRFKVRMANGKVLDRGLNRLYLLAKGNSASTETKDRYVTRRKRRKNHVVHLGLGGLYH